MNDQQLEQEWENLRKFIPPPKKGRGIQIAVPPPTTPNYEVVNGIPALQGGQDFSFEDWLKEQKKKGVLIRGFSNALQTN